MLTNNTFSKPWVFKFYQMLGKGITVVSLLMDKQEQVNPTQWWVTEPTKESFPFLVRRSSIGLLLTPTKTKNMKLMFPCLKFITRKFRTC